MVMTMSFGNGARHFGQPDCGGACCHDGLATFQTGCDRDAFTVGCSGLDFYFAVGVFVAANEFIDIETALLFAQGFRGTAMTPGVFAPSRYTSADVPAATSLLENEKYTGTYPGRVVASATLPPIRFPPRSLILNA